jgi:hypothetical protein
MLHKKKYIIQIKTTKQTNNKITIHDKSLFDKKLLYEKNINDDTNNKSSWIKIAY